MGVNNVKEQNTFRICILNGLRSSGLRFSDKQVYKNDDLALVIRRFQLPMDISYAVQSMYHGYMYHVGVLWNGVVYSYMPPMDNLLHASLKESVHSDDLKYFKSCGDTEVYYICNTGEIRNQIKTRLIYFMRVAQGQMTIQDFNRMYGTGLSEYYNIFINNCEHVANAILTGKNFSCQEELVDSDLRKYRGMLMSYRKDFPEFAKVWIDEYYRCMCDSDKCAVVR